MLQYLLATNSIDIIAGDFNDLQCRKINLDVFTNYAQIVNKRTLIYLDLRYIKKALMKELVTNEAMRILIEKNFVDFVINP